MGLTKSSVMSNMVTLGREQLQILNSVIARVFVNVVNDLSRFKITAQVLFHNKAMFKNVFQSSAMTVRREWMVIRGNYKNIAVRSYLATAFPVVRQMLAFAEHRIISTVSAFTKHRVFGSRDVAVQRGVGGGQIGSGSGATLTAKLARLLVIRLNRFLANLAVNYRSAAFAAVIASLRTIFQMGVTRIGVKGRGAFLTS